MGVVDVCDSGQWYTVLVNGQVLGRFGHQFDANCFAITLLRRGEISSVTLTSGMVLDDF